MSIYQAAEFTPPIIPNISLHNGVRMPVLGLGKNSRFNLVCIKFICWHITGLTHNGGYVHETVVHAIKSCGYRLLDTARRYGTEEFLPYAIQDAGLNRNQVTSTFAALYFIKKYHVSCYHFRCQFKTEFFSWLFEFFKN